MCYLDTRQSKCWGRNVYGQLGLGHGNAIGDNELPSSIGTIDFGEEDGMMLEVQKISSGNSFSCALLSNEKVKCWGRNQYGQLGLGHTNTIGDNELLISQQAIALREEAIDVSVGSDSACALLKSGQLQCWGRNQYGQLGLGHTNTIGDDETLEDLLFVTTGGDESLIYSRFSISSISPEILSPIQFDASPSVSKNEVSSYSWDFEDGLTQIGKSVTQSFTSVGPRKVKLTVTDRLGNSSFQEKTIVVEPAVRRLIMTDHQLFKMEKNKAIFFDLKPAQHGEIFP